MIFTSVMQELVYMEPVVCDTCTFYLDYREVQKAVNTAQGLFQRWTELLQDPSTATREEIDWTTNELRNNLRSIEWDLEDLDETINILSGQTVPFGAHRQRNVFTQMSSAHTLGISFYDGLILVLFMCQDHL